MDAAALNVAPADATPEQSLAASDEAAEGDAAPRAPRERRSRDRYGRDRRERAPREGDIREEVPAGAEPMPAVAAEQDEQRPVRSYFTQPASAAPSQVEQAPVVVAEPVAVPDVVTPSPAPAPMVAAAAAGMPMVAPYTLSMDELHSVAQASGLEWVNSDANKVAEIQAAIAAEPKPIHVPREPKPVVLVDEGPLVLVETRKDLRDVSLPFENR